MGAVRPLWTHCSSHRTGGAHHRRSGDLLGRRLKQAGKNPQSRAQALTQTVNRATAETQKELAEEEGLAPILAWAKALIDDIIASEFDARDLEFVWSTGNETDPVAQEA